MYKKILSAIIASTLSIAVNAQSDFRPGYVFFPSGDTLHGLIDYRGNTLMGTTCRFRKVDGTLQTFSPGEITGFRFIDSRFYLTRNVKTNEGNRDMFLEVIVMGRVSVLYLRNSQDRYFVEKDGPGLSELVYSEKSDYRDGKRVNVASTTHIGILNFYFHELPALKKRVMDMKKLVPEELVSLTDEYNRKMESRDTSPQIRFTKNQPLAKVMPELVGGFVHYIGNQVRDRNTTLGGVQVYFGLPRINERLFLRTGYIRSEVRLMEKTTILNKFPLAVDYVPLNHKVNIRASYGFNLYSIVSNTVTVSSGVSVRMKGRFLITVVPEAEFYTRYAFFPGRFSSYNIHVGILYKSK